MLIATYLTIDLLEARSFDDHCVKDIEKNPIQLAKF